MKQTALTFVQAKKEGRRLALLTAYEYTMARYLDEAGVDGILVGDSLGMVCLGQPDTLSVTMEDIIHHARAVAAAASRAMVIADLPFLSYQASVSEAVRNAGRLLKEGRAQAVKLEGGSEMAATIEAIVRIGIPVMGHIGLRPQAVNQLGGYKVQGRGEENARELLEAARAVAQAGAFAVVLECIPDSLAAAISKSIDIPTIGIGAGPQCDGQIMVCHDMLGMSGFSPRFVKRYADLGSEISRACKEYIQEVRVREFPSDEHSFQTDEADLKKLY